MLNFFCHRSLLVRSQRRSGSAFNYTPHAYEPFMRLRKCPQLDPGTLREMQLLRTVPPPPTSSVLRSRTSLANSGARRSSAASSPDIFLGVTCGRCSKPDRSSWPGESNAIPGDNCARARPLRDPYVPRRHQAMCSMLLSGRALIMTSFSAFNTLMTIVVVELS